MFHRARIGGRHRHWRNDLQIDAVAVQILDAPFHIPVGRIDSAEKAVAEQNIGFAALQVPDSGPVGRTVAVGKIGPRIGEEVSVDVNDHYFPGCTVPCTRLCTCNEALSKLFWCSLCSHKHRES